MVKLAITLVPHTTAFSADLMRLGRSVRSWCEALGGLHLIGAYLCLTGPVVVELIAAELEALEGGELPLPLACTLHSVAAGQEAASSDGARIAGEIASTQGGRAAIRAARQLLIAVQGEPETVTAAVERLAKMLYRPALAEVHVFDGGTGIAGELQQLIDV